MDSKIHNKEIAIRVENLHISYKTIKKLFSIKKNFFQFKKANAWRFEAVRGISFELIFFIIISIKRFCKRRVNLNFNHDGDIIANKTDKVRKTISISRKSRTKLNGLLAVIDKHLTQKLNLGGAAVCGQAIQQIAQRVGQKVLFLALSIFEQTTIKRHFKIKRHAVPSPEKQLRAAPRSAEY